MGITLNDIAAQRAMLKRGEEKRKAARQAEERERLRDTFAAAALTGLLSNIPRYQLGVIAVQTYEIADEMLRERLRHGAAESRETAKQLKDAEDFVRIREQFEAWQKEASVGVAEMDSAADRKSVATPRACASSCSQPFDSAPTTHDTPPQSRAGKNVAKTVQEVSKCTERENDHDAAPDARARDADRGRTDKAVTRPGEGTGNTPTPESYEKSDEKWVNTSTHRGIDRAAYEGDIVSRLKHWRGLHLAHSGELFEEAASEIERLREAIRRLADQDATLSVCDGNVTVTLDATLSGEERAAIELFASLNWTSIRWSAVEKHAATLRNLLERLK